MNIYSSNIINIREISQSIFLNNKYTKWYFNIIEKSQSENRKKLQEQEINWIYYEFHHILPKSIWPKYKNLKHNPWNGVLLTAKEHFIVHALLCKMCKNKRHFEQMLKAFRSMKDMNVNKFRYTSRLFEYFRIKWKQSISNSLKNKKKTKQHNINNSNAQKLLYKNGYINPFTNKTHIEESIRKIKDARKNQIITEETKIKMRLASNNNNKIKHECPHCHKFVAKQPLHTWHLDKCKLKIN